MGHVMRCARLCEYLRHNLIPEPRIIFAMAEYGGVYDGPDESLKKRLPLNIGPDLPCPPESYDRDYLPKTLRQFPQDLLIVDCNWEKYPEIIQQLPDGLPVISLHEHNFPLLRDIKAAVNPSLVEQEPAPGGEIGVTHFQGPGYLMLDEEIQRRVNTKPRDLKGPVEILICLGGADPEGYTCHIAEALSGRDNIQLNVIAGPAFPEEFYWRLKDNPVVDLLEAPPRVIPIIAHTDIAIVNGATTMFESLALGTPTIAVPRNPYEKKQAEICAEAGAALMSLPEDIGENIPAHIEKIISDPQLRSNLSLNGTELIDGKGLSRVGGIIIEALTGKST